MIHLNQSQREKIALRIISDIENYAYSIDGANKIIEVKDDEFAFKIFRSNTGKIVVEVNINNNTITDESPYWTDYYTTLENHIENHIEASKTKAEFLTIQKLNDYLG